MQSKYYGLIAMTASTIANSNTVGYLDPAHQSLGKMNINLALVRLA